MTIREGDDERAIRTNAKGEIELTAAQVRAMAGPVDTSAHVAIPALPLYLGARLPDGWALPLPAKRKAAAGYAVASDVGFPFWTGVGVRSWRDDRRAGLLVTDEGDWNWIDRGAAMAAAETVADAEPVAAVTVELLESPDSIADAEPLVSVAEDAERADAATSPAQRRVCPVVPAPLSPFAVAAVDDGPDTAAMVAELLQRVAALEAERMKPAAVAGTSADYAAPGDDRRDAWEAELAARAGVVLEPVIPEQRGDYAEAMRQLAAMTAQRDALQDECDFLQAARGRTAVTLSNARRERHDARRLAAQRFDDMATMSAKVDATEREAARLRTLAPLAGIQWNGGHAGAVVMPKTPTRVPAPPARLIVANGRRVAA